MQIISVKNLVFEWFLCYYAHFMTFGRARTMAHNCAERLGFLRTRAFLLIIGDVMT